MRWLNFEDTIEYAKYIEKIPLKFEKKYFSKCVLLVRYWMTIGMSETKIKKELKDRLKILFVGFNEDIVVGQIGAIINEATSRGLLVETEILFSKEELDFIHNFSVDNIDLQKIMFALLCFYKTEGNKEFTFNLTELSQMAKIKYNTKYIDELLFPIIGEEHFTCKVRNIELLHEPSKEIISLFNPDNIAIETNSLKNIVYRYLDYIGVGSYIFCEDCGCIEKRNSSTQKYCRECSKIRNQKKEIGETICSVCGDIYIKNPFTQKDKCDKCYNVSINAERRIETVDVECPKCGTIFTKTGNNQRDICEMCYQRQRRENKTETMRKLRLNK